MYKFFYAVLQVPENQEAEYGGAFPCKSIRNLGEEGDKTKWNEDIL